MLLSVVLTMEIIVADHCHIVGGRVKAKACHVKDLFDCICWYGINGKTKEAFGTVVTVKYSLTATNCTNTFIVADYDFGNNIVKRASLKIRSIIFAPLCVVTKIALETSPARAAAMIMKPPTTTPNTNPAIAPLTQDQFNAAPALLQPAREIRPNPNPNPLDNNPLTVVCHGKSWYEDDAKTLVDINGPIPSRKWVT